MVHQNILFVWFYINREKYLLILGWHNLINCSEQNKTVFWNYLNFTSKIAYLEANIVEASPT